MKIAVRLFQFMNSFYHDNNAKDFDVSGDYCCLGYFDALNVKKIEINQDEKMREKIYEQIINTIDGKCSQKNIICVTQEVKKDAAFWEKRNIMPYLFVTMVHIQHEKSGTDENADKVEKLIKEINRYDNSMAYYNYDHCEVVIAYFAKSYGDGIKFIFEHLGEDGIYKLYSTFCVCQELVNDKEKLIGVIEREHVDCLLRASLKNLKELDVFEKEVKIKFPNEEDGEGRKIEHVKVYRVLGSKDIVIHLTDVPMEDLLECYKSSQLFNHNCELYWNTFFNIETEILKAGKRGE